MDYKDHKGTKKRTFRAKKRHLNLFYLFSLAVILLVTPLVVLQLQGRTNLRQEAAPSSQTEICESVNKNPENIRATTCVNNFNFCEYFNGRCQLRGLEAKRQQDQRRVDNPPPATSCDVQNQNCPAGQVCKANPGSTRSGTCVKTTSAPPPAGNPPPAGDPDARCKAIGGTCQADNIVCSGGYQSGLCGGGSNRRCCRPGGAPPVNNPPPAGGPVTCPSTPSNDTACTNAGGACVTDNALINARNGDPFGNGTVRTCLCSGGNNRRCIVPNSNNNQNPGNPGQPGPDGQSNPGQPNTATASLGMSIKLQGIGPGGNSDPKLKQISVALRLYKDNITTQDITASGNVLAAATMVVEGTAAYNSSTGLFENSDFDLGEVPAGNYRIIAQTERFLDAQLVNATTNTDVFNIQPGQKVLAATVEMRGGDAQPLPRGNNYIDLFDYNAVWGCTSGQPENACLNRDFADINDDGLVDQVDLDIVRSNFGEEGFAFDTGEFVCKSDPECTATGSKNALQMCRLLCTKKSDRL